eukprot:6205392-Pleurochrysis_carterae.AAC.3
MRVRVCRELYRRTRTLRHRRRRLCQVRASCTEGGLNRAPRSYIYEACSHPSALWLRSHWADSD